MLPVRPKIVSIPSEVTRSRGNGKSLNGEISFSRSNIWASPNEDIFYSALSLHRVFDLAAFLGPFHHQPRFRGWERKRVCVRTREIRDEKWTRRGGARMESGKKREEGKGRARKGEWVCTLARLNTMLLTG